MPALEARAALRSVVPRSWSGERAFGARCRVLRPWPDFTFARRRYQIEREWTQGGAEVGAALSAPPPGGRLALPSWDDFPLIFDADDALLGTWLDVIVA